MHDVALTKLYPEWGFDNIKSEVGTHKDYHDKIDYVAMLGDKHLTIQERFRNAKYSPYKDVTIRYENGAEKRAGEFSKIKADIFIYGISNYRQTDFLWAVCFDIQKLLLLIGSGKIDMIHKKNKESDDNSFVAITIPTLREHNLILFEY
jgi:hypothetical protein